jgi:hypothetical protein
VKPPLIQAFHDFAFQITPTRGELEDIQERADAIEQAVRDIAGKADKLFESLSRHLGRSDWGPAPLRYLDTRPFGSSQRGTLIRPIGTIDVDLLLAFEGSPVVMIYFDDGQNFLRAIADLLSGLPCKCTLFEGECVRLDYGRPPLLDIFAGIDWFGNRAQFSFPHGRREIWYRSNPVVFDEWLLRRNRELQGRLTLMLRMLKSWNRHRRVGLRSFHLETLGAREFQELHGYWPAEILTFLEAGSRKGVKFLAVSSHDGYTQDLSADQSAPENELIIDEFNRSAEVMRRGIAAEKRKNLEAAVSAFRSVLGNAFPDWQFLASTYGY